MCLTSCRPIFGEPPNHGARGPGAHSISLRHSHHTRGRCGGTRSTLTQEPAVPIRKSVFHDYIICLEDGTKRKVLKRHFKIAYNMTPEDYRTKWGLPHSYPMTAPGYAERRSTLAKENGLGRTKEPLITSVPEPVIQRIPEKRRGTRQPRSTEEA